MLQRIVMFYCALYAVQKIETEFLSRKIAQHDPPHGSSWFAISAEFDELLYNTGFYQMQLLLMLLQYERIISSVRSSNSHPDLLVIHHHHPHFFRSHRSSTLDFHFLSHYSYIKAIMLYKGNHWTRCAGLMDASWVRLGIINDDLGTSWALPGDNLGMTWG